MRGRWVEKNARQNERGGRRWRGMAGPGFSLAKHAADSAVPEVTAAHPAADLIIIYGEGHPVVTEWDI